jgi:hypothetical protein
VRYELTRIRALREIGDSLRSHVKEVIVGSQETRWRALQTCAPRHSGSVRCGCGALWASPPTLPRAAPAPNPDGEMLTDNDRFR